MTTVINNPGDNTSEDSATTLIVGVGIIIIVILFMIYGLPMIRGNNSNPPKTDNVNIDVTVPANSGTQPAPAQ